MLTIYRRHEKACPQKTAGRKYRRCRCPVWVHGTLTGEKIRRSLRTRDWQGAQRLVNEWEAKDCRIVAAEPVTVEQACEGFLRDAEARNLREPTLYKYRLLFRQLKAFARDNGLQFIKQCDLEVVRRFRESWPNRNIAARKKLEALRAFFRFCWESDWISDNPAGKLKAPKVTDPPTMPFTREQVSKILAACNEHAGGRGRAGRANTLRLRALVLLLRFSGLRICDAVTLRRDRIVDGKLLLYTAKTGIPVYCPLPPFVMEALEMAPRTSNEYFFWSGAGKPKSCVGDWQRSLKELFRLAGVPDGHAHRFRHTFAVELLLAGVPLERVSVLLGHQSVKVTEKHYAPWVRARQEQLEADVRRVWSQVPEELAATNGTQQVRGKREVVN